MIKNHLNGMNTEICIRKSSSFNLIVVSIAFFFLPFCFETSFTFQSIFYLMVLVLINGMMNKIALRKSTVNLIVCFMFVTGFAYLHSLFISPEILTVTAMSRAILFFCILMTYAFAVAPDYSPQVVSKALRLTALSSVISSLLVLFRFVSMGYYFGRIYPISFFGDRIDANYFAVILVLQSGIALLIALYESSATRKCLYFALYALCFLAIMLTGSRSGLLCIFISTLIQLVIYFRQRVGTKLVTITFVALLLIVALFLVGNYVSDWLLDRFFKESYIDESNQFRVYLWENAVKRVMTRPLFGFGVGNYSYYSAQDWGVSSVSNAAHGTFVDYLVDFGIIGLVAFCYIFFSPVKRLIKNSGLPFLGIVISFFIAAFIIGAERTVALWVFIIEFDVVSRTMSRFELSTYELVNSMSFKRKGLINFLRLTRRL